MSVPFRFRSEEAEVQFIQMLNDAILATTFLPGDNMWHEVELRFDILCPKGVNEEPTIRTMDSGFMLGGPSAG